MITKRHDCKLTEQIVRQIEYILPKLKYSVYIQQVRSWLENFEEDEVVNALDFLFYLEYIPFSELQLRLNQQLVALDKYFGCHKKYLLIPYAQYPKSNDIVMYLLTKCDVYKRLESEKRINITLDIQHCPIENNVVFVYVDDFIGSGKSFDKWHKKSQVSNRFSKNPRPHDEQALLAALIMEDGCEFIKYRYPEVQIFAEFRARVFCRDTSPFNLSGNRPAMRRLCLKYGIDIATRFHPPNKVLYDPFGFDKSEALVAFDYGTPNNSLPIIWCDGTWKSIFPRSGTNRMKRASEVKSEAAFYLGIMHKLQIDFDDDIEDGDVQLSARDDHAILVYMVLADRLYPHLQICQTLGITLFELDKIILKAHKKRLVNRDGKLTRRGVKFLSEIKKKNNIFKFREKDTLKVRDHKIFVPKSFRNMT